MDSLLQASSMPPETPSERPSTPSTGGGNRLGQKQNQQQEQQRNRRKYEDIKRSSPVDPSPPPRLTLGGAFRRTLGRDDSSDQLGGAKTSASVHGASGVSASNVPERRARRQSESMIPSRGVGAENAKNRRHADNSGESQAGVGFPSGETASAAGPQTEGNSINQRLAPSAALMMSGNGSGGGGTLRRRERNAANITSENVQQTEPPLSPGNRRKQTERPHGNSSGGTRSRSSRQLGHRSCQDGYSNGGGSRQSEATPVSRSSAAVGKSSAVRRNPLPRYLLLSGALIVSGLTVRYLWRELLGLTGGLFILAALRRGKLQKKGTADVAVRRRPRGQKNDGNIEPTPSAPAPSDVPSNVRSEEALVALASHETEEASGGGQPAEAGVGLPGLWGENAVVERQVEFGGAFAGSPSELRQYWLDGGPACPFLVRGSSYMSDKTKIPAGPAAMRLVHVDLFAAEEATFNVASKGRCRDRVVAFVKSFENRGERAPFLFILNILIPGTPVVSTVMYWALMDEGREGDTDKTFLDMLGRYAEVPGSGYKKLDRRRSASAAANPLSDEQLNQATSSPVNAGDGNPAGHGGAADTEESGKTDCTRDSGSISDLSTVTDGAAKAMGEAPAGTRSSLPLGDGDTRSPEEGVGEEGLLPADDFRNERFKLIPSVVAGPFIVRKAVGNKPALLGRKLRQRYFRGSGYVETDVDVGSSMVAAKIVALCRGYARTLTVELGVCLEGRCEEELPEKCIGVIRLVNLDLEGAEPLELPVPIHGDIKSISQSVAGVHGIAPPAVSQMSGGDGAAVYPVAAPAQVASAGGARRTTVATNA